MDTKHPHHDGSDLYLSTSSPELGELVEFKVRTPIDFQIEKAFIRIYHDSEPRTFEMSLISTSPWEKWWSVRAPVINLVAQYRFLFVGKTGYHWPNRSRKPKR